MTERRPAAPRPARGEELRLHGLNACLAAFARRPQDLRKVYLSQARLADLREVLAHCVRQRLGYRVVEEADLQRLSGSSHHEGVVFDIRRPRPCSLPERLLEIGERRSLLLWLDGVGNPHNLGAILRSAAHFGVDAVLIPPGSGLGLSGAACRVAEGGAEALPLIRLADTNAALELLQQHRYTLAATLVSGGDDVYTTRLPSRLVWVFGAEQTGVSRELLAACALKLHIPGTGAVESLNVAAAAAVLMGEWAANRNAQGDFRADAGCGP